MGSSWRSNVLVSLLVDVCETLERLVDLPQLLEELQQHQTIVSTLSYHPSLKLGRTFSEVAFVSMNASSGNTPKSRIFLLHSSLR